MTMMMVRTSEITKEEEGRGRKSDSSAEMSSNAMGFSPSRAAATISGVSSVPTANATIGEKFTLKDDRLDCGGVRTARFKMMKPPRFPIKISSNISNHLGLRLVDLLDSPILQPPNEQAEPSPTTGTSPLPPIVQGSGSTPLSPSDPVKEKKSVGDGGQIIIYKPVPSFGRNAISSLSGIDNAKEDMDDETPKTLEPVPPLDMCKDITPLRILFESSGPEVLGRAEQDQGIAHTQPNSTIISSDDGYHWRKYGQKVVKNSKFPRSYFRCAHPSCPVKKMVEESKVVIKGDHDHPMVQAIKRSGTSPMHSISRNSKDGLLAVALRVDDSYDHVTDTSTSTRDKVQKPCSGITQISEPSLASTNASGGSAERKKVNDKEDIIMSVHGNDNDDSKCRKKPKVGETASKMSFRTFREPRCVERIKCQSNVVDDGYRWCKYGQKRIKGNPHPRSYYKCHNPGCPVRKHVERSSTDEMTIISTYEGKHNHEAPSSRLNSNSIAGSFITAITLPTISNPPSSLLRSDLLSQHDQGSTKTSNDDRMVCDNNNITINNNKAFEFSREILTSEHQCLNETSDKPNSNGNRISVINALPLSTHWSYPEREAVSPSTFNYLKSGIDEKSAIQNAESRTQDPSSRLLKVEPSDLHLASDLLSKENDDASIKSLNQ